jgi:hypothetical protein
MMYNGIIRYFKIVPKAPFSKASSLFYFNLSLTSLEFNDPRIFFLKFSSFTPESFKIVSKVDSSILYYLDHLK